MSWVELTDDDFDADDDTDEDNAIDDEVFIEEEDEILCCDFIVLSVCLLQSRPWHTVFNASLKLFHLIMMMVMVMLVMMVMVTFDTFGESFCSQFPTHFEAENLLGAMELTNFPGCPAETEIERQIRITKSATSAPSYHVYRVTVYTRPPPSSR